MLTVSTIFSVWNGLAERLMGRCGGGFRCPMMLAAYREICAISGSKSQDAKIGKMQKLMISATPCEAKYVTRGLQGKLRIGLAETSVLIAFAHALVRSPPVSSDLMETDEKLPSVTREITGAQASHALKIDASRGSTLGKKRLTKDERLIAAEAVMKQCYAEAPSYKALAAGVLAQLLARLLSVSACEVASDGRPKVLSAQTLQAWVRQRYRRFELEQLLQSLRKVLTVQTSQFFQCFHLIRRSSYI